MVISLIGMAYLPELKTSKVYLQYIKPADSLGPQLLGLIPPNDNDDNFNEIGGMQMVNDGHNNNYQQQQQTAILPPPPRGRFDDEKRLSEKIQQHFSQQQKTVIPKPNIPKSSPTSSPIVQSNSLDNHHDNVNNQHLVALYEPIRRQSNWTRIQLPNGEDGDPEIRKKRDKIKQMMIVAWDSYKKYAWGENELKPIKKTGHAPGVFGKTKLGKRNFCNRSNINIEIWFFSVTTGATIVDGMDTLYIMGLMDRFEDGRQWIAENLDFNNIGSEISVFETIIRYVGGLLTCYAFTKDEMFLQKAVNITQRMLPAFDTPTGLPHALIKPALGTSRNYAWASQSNSILSEVGTLSLEFYYLTALTGDQIYYNKIDRIQTILDSLPKPNGLYPNYINPKTGKFGQSKLIVLNFEDLRESYCFCFFPTFFVEHISLGALGDSFYEYLLKLWLMMDKKQTTSLRMYNEAVDAIDKKLVQKSSSGLVYVADLRYERLEHKMGHLACFAAGMFALGAKENAHDEHRAEHFLKLGSDIAETCHESYIRTKTNIGPEVFWFTGQLDAQIGKYVFFEIFFGLINFNFYYPI